MPVLAIKAVLAVIPESPKSSPTGGKGTSFVKDEKRMRKG
jgi:hypothetical protein